VSVLHTASVLYDALLAIIYPQACTICGGSVESRTLGVACNSCWRRTQIFTGQETVCWKCGRLSPGIVADDKREQVRCHRCDVESFSAARACGVYEGALRASVLSLKREPYICQRIVEMLSKAQRRVPLNQATLVIPVPLHSKREKARGYNQAALLARSLCRMNSLPLDETSLIRTQHADRHRAGLDAKDRRQTVANSFQVAFPGVVAGERVLLIDDVFTTGATASACAEALRLADADEVFVLTLARPPRS
jgi:ComF family protein